MAHSKKNCNTPVEHNPGYPPRPTKGVETTLDSWHEEAIRYCHYCRLKLGRGSPSTVHYYSKQKSSGAKTNGREKACHGSEIQVYVGVPCAVSVVDQTSCQLTTEDVDKVSLKNVKRPPCIRLLGTLEALRHPNTSL